MKKIVSRILAVLLIAATVLTAAGCKKDNSAAPKDMVVASDELCSFYLYVPEKWTVDHTEGTGGAFYSTSDPSSVFVSAWDMPNTDSTIADWWNTNLTDLELIFSDLTIVSEDTTVVDGLEAKSYTYTANLGEYSYKFMQIACLKNGTVYLFTYTSQPEQFDSHMGDVEKMLEHFKIK